MHKEIEKALGRPTSKAAFIARYVGAQKHEKRKKDEQSALEFWGLDLPKIREAAKTQFSFSHMDEEEQWDVWMQIWRQSPVYDVKSVALIWLCSPKRKKVRLKKWRDVLSLTQQVDNWAHSDSISSVIAEILEERPQIFSVLKKWNRSRNPWLRRQSLVGIYCYARMRKKKIPASRSLPLVKNLLLDPHFYVQRGVGWTLREIDRVDSKKQRAFVRRYVKQISAVAWFATTELYPVPLRKNLLLKRR